MTRLDLLTVASGAIAGLTGYLVWRNRDKAAAFAEALDPRGTTPRDVERSITNLQGQRYLESCIWIDPGRQSGAPCLGGTRIPVASLVAAMETDNPQAWYPQATREHVATVEWWLQQPGVKTLLRRPR